MEPSEFNQFLRVTLNEIQETLSAKEQVYSSNANRFHNFNRAAIMDWTTPIRSLRGMQTKHRVAISDFLNEPITDTPYHEWREKIIDNINYYILMLAMVYEEHENH